VLDKVAKTAALLDQAQGGDAFARSVNLQRAKLDNPELTPSAQVLKALRESGLSYSQWVLQVSAGHRQAAEHPLDAGVQQALQAEAERSLAEQALLEQAEQPPFDQFLAEYVAG
jgi:glutamate--cysteine ligase